ncbi:nuclear transport factor 2 family protein [Microbacterium sp. CFBP9034]|uniref:nuclear transport factor 2 family protein n=1 Tax=Microbacterium sp. CFBP9034 TaxID=3096540 RepID=UPI002A69EC26|nr:nuclear transport factor 2 family protein [Microbacterium sp. CFBP9034]MDY0910798.1 nuclear transport factor 2 family protein [Microbacterium sp. CFBP9034]
MWDREAAADAAREWMARYVLAWGTNDPDDIRSLFTADAEYRDGPSTAPWVGHDAILDGWLGQKDDPGTWSFEYELVAVDGDVAIIRGRTSYPAATEKSHHYDNLMVITLTAGRARSFTDWFVIPDDSQTDE